MHFKKFLQVLKLIVVVLFLYSMAAEASLNVWDVLADEFSLNHEITRPEVQNQIHWIVSHPSYLQQLARKSEPYIYHIVTAIKKKHLPGEIALIPMIESSYDPFAYSGVGAAGLWQLMPGTGTDLGLKQDWWYDGRRSIGPSTDAALNYLTYLHNFFHGDWLLAFAAYDSGEGTVAKAIKNNQTQLEKSFINFFKIHKNNEVGFWSLKLPQETRAYIPRLLALAEVMKNPKRYKIQLPVIPHEPYFEEVNIGSQIDLNHAAKLAGISYKDLIKLNPGFNRWATAPYQPFKLLIPINKVQQFNKNLANFPIANRLSWNRQKIENHPYALIPKVKLIPKIKKDIKPKLAIANKKIVPTSNKQLKVIHIVQRNETLASIEKKYNVTAQQIEAWNHINTKRPLQISQQLIIWKPAVVIQFYLVKPGDNIGLIAQKYKISPLALAQLNPGLLRHTLQPGQKLRIT